MLKTSKCCLCGRKITVSSQIEHGSYKVRPVPARLRSRPHDDDSVCYNCFKDIIRWLAVHPDALVVPEQIDIFA